MGGDAASDGVRNGLRIVVSALNGFMTALHFKFCPSSAMQCPTALSQGDILMNHSLSELDELIAHEKKQAAIEYQHEAWADGISEGIEPEILAEAAFANALTELLRSTGEDAALGLLDKLREQIIAGEFLPNRILQ